MEIVVNGIERQQNDSLTISLLLENEGYAGRRVAVEINGSIVPKSAHAQYRLAAGDRVEIVQAIGGG
jgi:sulfur carrier protein